MTSTKVSGDGVTEMSDEGILPEAGRDLEVVEEENASAIIEGNNSTSTDDDVTRTPPPKEGKGDGDGAGADGSSAFLNLRPPSDSPARASSSVNFDLPPAVGRFRLPTPVMLTPVEKVKENDMKLDLFASQTANEDEHTRKRPRDSSSPDQRSVATKRDRSVEPRDRQPLKKRIDASAPVSNAGEKSVAIMFEDFDPITLSHLQLAAEIVHNDTASEVWLMPTSELSASPKVRTPSRERWLMCHLAVNSTFPAAFPIRVESCVMDNPMYTKLPDIYAALKNDHPDIHFRFVVSSDDARLKHIDENDELSSRKCVDDDDEFEDAKLSVNQSMFASSSSTPPLLIVPSPGTTPEMAKKNATGSGDVIVFDVQNMHFALPKKVSATVKHRMKLACASNLRDVRIDASSSEKHPLYSGFASSSENLKDWTAKKKIPKTVMQDSVDTAGDEAGMNRSAMPTLCRKRVASRCEALLPTAVLNYIEKYDVPNRCF